jgi:Tol biopolymer transport system component
MPLPAGTHLGSYGIVELIGKGGMGEVYRARDTRLKRDIALKVLPGAFASEPDRLTRFQREAEVLASLNHPNIAAIYGIEHADGVHALAMEFVEGASPKGPMPFEEAWKICSQIADALEYAHDKGVVHRDLKPANVKVTPDGTVKLLDFGLAKAMSAQREASPTSAAVENSPTLTMGATHAGVILGTAAYMAPEQAKGKPVDKRADIWAFGVVLYELLTGQRPFRGEDIGDILAAVIKEEPDYVPVPAQAQRLVRRCLAKDPKKRLRDIGAASDLLTAEPAPAAAAPAPSRFGLAGWIAAAALAVTASVAGYGWWRATRPTDKPLVRLSVDLGPDAIRGSRITAVLSPDGTHIAYVGKSTGGLFHLLTRRLDQTEATVLTGTESSTYLQPFFSPDGQWIGFNGDGVLKKISVQGGAAVTLSTIGGTMVGASWGGDGNIVRGATSGLRRIPEAGGSDEPLVPGAAAPGPQVFPQVLPGAKAVLFNSAPAAVTSLEDLDISVLTLSDGKVKTLLHGGYFPRYLPTSRNTGHLVYVHDGTLFGVAFNPSRLEVSGTPVPLVEGVAADDTVNAGGQFDASDSGTLVYLSGKLNNSARTMQWLDAAGQTKSLVSQPGAYSAPRLSPDGKRLAYTAAGSKGVDVWVYDLDRGTPAQITFTGPGAREVAWAPDSKHLVFGDGSALWWIRADGSGQPRKILDHANNPRPTFFSSDGRLAYAPAGGGNLPDVWTLPVDLSDAEHPKPGKAEPFLADPQIAEVDPAFSPDGKFIAYASNESGAEEIFVRPFPGPGGKWKISDQGGKFPVFARATRELFFLGGDDRIWVADYTIQDGAFNAGQPRVWSPAKITRDGVRQNFDISADGKRAVVFPAPVAEKQEGDLHAMFLFNFFDYVRRTVPVAR